MSSANAQDLAAVFKEIDTNHDGYISRADLEATPHAQSLFDNDDNALIAFNKLEDKMNQADFILLASGYKLKLHHLAVAKFEFAKTVRKYYNVTAPGEAGPSLKQSFIKFSAHNQKPNDKIQKVGIEFGIDKVQQDAKIKQLAQVLGHNPHQIFFLLKFKTNSNGHQIAQKLNGILNDILEMVKSMAPEIEQFVNIIKIYVKYANGYTYLVIQIDNPFIDSLVGFLNEVVEAISPVCQLKFKSYLSSNVHNILKEDFNYEGTSGQILTELDIDNVTLHKIKRIVGDQAQPQEKPSPVGLISALLFEELKLSVEFNNLGQALQSAFSLNTFPKPSDFLGPIKEMGLKETLGQFSQGAVSFLDEIKANCQAQGEISLNFHDFYVKTKFDISIESAFDLL